MSIVYSIFSWLYTKKIIFYDFSRKEKIDLGTVDNGEESGSWRYCFEQWVENPIISLISHFLAHCLGNIDEHTQHVACQQHILLQSVLCIK